MHVDGSVAWTCSWVYSVLHCLKSSSPSIIYFNPLLRSFTSIHMIVTAKTHVYWVWLRLYSCIHAYYSSTVHVHGSVELKKNDYPLLSLLRTFAHLENINTTEFMDCVATSFPGSSLFPPRESTLVGAGHVPMHTNQICTEGGSSI